MSCRPGTLGSWRSLRALDWKFHIHVMALPGPSCMNLGHRGTSLLTPTL